MILNFFLQKLELDRFMLYAHGSDLCHDLELRHAMANCFEALMGEFFVKVLSNIVLKLKYLESNF